MPYQINSEICIGCTACAGRCPVFAIAGARGSAHHINPRRCVSCGVCGRVCPRGAVADGAGTPCAPVPRAQWRRPVVDAGACSACGMCAAVCTPGALRISLPRFRGDLAVYAELYEPDRCVGCGLCERECPLGAISLGEEARS